MRFINFTIILVVCLLAGYFTIQHYDIETLLAKAPTQENLSAISRLTTLNAEVDAGLGRFYQFSTEDFDLNRAVSQYFLALTRNPYDYNTWVNLAMVLEMMNRIPQARLALQDAVLASPATAVVHWTLANFLIRNALVLNPNQGNTKSEEAAEAPVTTNVNEALAELRKSIDLDSTTLMPSLELATRSGIDPVLVYKTLVPREVSMQRAALQIFVQLEKWNAAHMAWNTLLSMTRVPSTGGKAATRGARENSLSAGEMMPYLDALMNANRVDESEAAWTQILPVLDREGRAEGKPPVALKEPDNLIFNPDFRSDPLNAGFDWRVLGQNDVNILLDPAVHYRSGRSLLIEFQGKANIDFGGVFQFVPVHPSSSYNFSAWVKTDHLTTDQGILAEIVLLKPRKLIRTDQVTGSNDWTELHAEFTTDAETQLIMVRFRRLPSGRFDNLIRGRAWIGHVELKEKISK